MSKLSEITSRTHRQRWGIRATAVLAGLARTILPTKHLSNNIRVNVESAVRVVPICN